MKKKLLKYLVIGCLSISSAGGFLYYKSLKNMAKKGSALVLNNKKKSHKSDYQQKTQKTVEPFRWASLLTSIKELADGRRAGEKKLKVFISYAWENCNSPEGKEENGRLQQDLEKLRNDLQSAGLSVFLDISDMHGNMKDRMQENLVGSDIVFVILTPRFRERVQDKTTNVYFEYSMILEKIKEKPYALFPLLYSGNFNDAVPQELLNYLIRDWRNKKNYKTLMVDIQRPLGIIPAIYNISSDDGAYKKLLSTWRLKHFNNISLFSNGFFNRKKILDNLHSLYSQQNNVSEFISLVGMVGTGKSQLALEFAKDNLYRYEAVRWIKGQKENLKTEFLSMATDLGIDSSGMAIEELVRKIYKILSPFSWLLIFDDVEDYEDIQGYLPKKFNKNQHVLITSQNQSWISKVAVPPFQKKEAIKYLKKHIEGIKDQEAEKLSETLGYLPEAITLAIRYIKETKISVKEYLKIYKKEKMRLLESYKTTKLQPTLSARINEKLSRIKERDKDAFLILTICGYLHHENIPLKLLKKTGLITKKEQLHSAFRELYRFSLVEPGIFENHLTINPITQEAIKEIMSEENKQKEILPLLQKLKNELTFMYSEKLSQQPEKKILLSHLEKLKYEMEILQESSVPKESEKN